MQELRRTRRELKLLERKLAEEESLRGQDNSRALSILTEAQNVGLLPSINPSDDETPTDLLRPLLSWTPAHADSPESTSLASLQHTRDSLFAEFRSTQRQIEAARSFATAADDFGVEAGDQKNRLTSINLFSSEPEVNRCPVCEHDLEDTVPKAASIQVNLASLARQMAATTRQRPRLEAYLAEQEERLAQLRQELTENKASLEALISQEEVLQEQRDRMVQQARVVGKISLFFDRLRLVKEDRTLQTQVDSLRTRIEQLEAELSEDQIEDQLTSILQVIGRTMSEWSQRMSLEHSESPVGFDIKNLTVIAYRESGPIRMHQMGSGENWMGYHVITHLALHKWFVEKERPVPGLLMFDQPTQVYFPSEPTPDRSVDELADEDRAAVRRLFEFIFEITDALTPNLQVIVTDHADLNEDWFQAAVRERWRGGVRLIPASWYEADNPTAEVDAPNES